MPATLRRALILGAFVAAAAVLTILAFAPPGHAAAEESDVPPAHLAGEAGDESEIRRIRVHFDSVLAELHAADVSHLAASQRATRAERIAVLAAYRDRGMFPHNHDFAESWTPYFVDHRGVACAVAHLLEQSGRRDIVDRVAAARNNVWVAELTADREFTEWLDASGLTLSEAARIQVPYDFQTEEPSAARFNQVNTGAAILAGGLGLAAIALNAGDIERGHVRLRTALGFTAGALGLAVAATRAEAEGSALTVGIAAGTIGLGSALMATRTVLGRRQLARAAAAQRPAFSVAPSVSTTGGEVAPAVVFNFSF